MPACDVATALHVGPFDQIAAAYLAIGEWLQENGMQSDGAMWEIYLTDPESEPDPAKWQMMVYYPINPE